MNPALEDLLRESRRQIREWKRPLALFDAGVMRLHSNGVDISAQHMQDLHRYIAEHAALIEKYDPEGLTADANVEFGDVGQLASELYANRPLAVALNSDGLGEVLHVFDTDADARSFAQSRPGYHAGHVSQDGWSITSIEP